MLLDAPNLPVVGVTWYEAEAYCNWVSAATRQRFRLPTEAEWEKAARGERGRLWPWADEWDANKCNSGEGGGNATTPVGMYPDGASAYVALDMVGNVWEWCADWWADDLYKQRAAQGQAIRDPTGPASSSARAVRGGSWINNRRNCRVAYRNRNAPANFNDNLGFRLARSPV